MIYFPNFETLQILPSAYTGISFERPLRILFLSKKDLHLVDKSGDLFKV